MWKRLLLRCQPARPATCSQLAADIEWNCLQKKESSKKPGRPSPCQHQTLAPIDPAELLPGTALRNHKWDHCDVEEATGNEGARMDRWYHHAALVLWPHSKYWKVKCYSDLGGAVEVRFHALE